MGAVATEAKTALCQCAELFNAAEPGRERCLIMCGAEINAKWVMCRPCAKGNHTGQPCPQHVPESSPNLIKTCARCGFDGAVHERGSDGSPNGA